MEYGPTSEHLAFQVHLTWRAARKTLLAEVEKGEEPVSRGSYSIPILIGLNPGINPMQLANALHLDASKVAYFLRDLDRDGLIERTRSKTDGRAVELRLTPAGEAHSRKAGEASARIEAPFDGILSAEEKDTLITLLMKLRNGLG